MNIINAAMCMSSGAAKESDTNIINIILANTETAMLLKIIFNRYVNMSIIKKISIAINVFVSLSVNMSCG
jgi:hypothetical protein